MALTQFFHFIFVGFLTIPGVSSFSFPETCSSVVGDTAYGQSEVLDAITDPTIYDVRKRPNVAAKSNGDPQTAAADVVTIQLEVAHVNEFNQHNQELELSIYETRMWWDKRLAFNKTGDGQCVTGNGLHNDSSVIVIRKEHYEGINRIVWTPSTYYTNSKHSPTESSSALFIRNDGLVTHTQQKSIQLSCTMDFKKYPFDRHVCPVKMSTWEHTNNKVEIKAGNVTFNDDFLDIQAPVDGQTSFSFGQFDVSTNTNTEISEDDSKRTITGTMIFHRDSDSFYIAVFLPDLLLHAAIFASLFISTKVAGSPARVSICIIAVLAFRIIMSDVYAALPPVSYSIWLVDYMAVSQIIALIALMEFTVISSLLGKEVHKANIRKAMSGSSVPELLKLGHSITDIFEEAARRHHELVDSQESLFKWSVWFNPIAPKRPRKMSVNTIELNKVPSKQIEKTPTSKTSETTEGSEQSIDDVAFLSSVTPREEIRLHARDVQHMAYAKEIFDKYDTDNNGKISISELRQCLRYFGMYYTYRQTAGMMEAYFSDHGLSIATEKDLDEAAFFFLIVQHQKYEPFEDTSPDLFSGPPSEVIDKVAQVVYPCAMIAKIVFFKFWLTTYN